MVTITESTVEPGVLEWLAVTKCQVAYALDTLYAKEDTLLPNLASREIEVDGGFAD